MEEWKPVAGYEGWYEVSNLGRVKRTKRANGTSCGMKKGIVNKTNYYLHVSLSRENRERNFYVHRLVAIAFIPNPEGKKQVNHLDFNRQNNRCSNLEWSSAKENYHYSNKAGRTSKPPTGVRFAKRKIA